jgi:predicted acyltransferase
VAERFRSLDVFRGATVALMILVNNPGSWSALYPPLAHAPWHGCTPTDLVFPFFLFAVGNALALVMPGLQAAGPAVFWPRVLKRTALIFAIGLLLNAAPFVVWSAQGELVMRDWHTLRWMGVLQRIALCFGLAAAIVWCLGRAHGHRGHDHPPAHGAAGPLWASAVLLVGYAATCHLLGAPGDPFSLQGWFGTAVDTQLLGAAHLYRGEGVPFDPEGLASTAPAVAQVLLGWWVGRSLVGRRMDAQAVASLCLWGVALLVVGYLWQLDVPLNKKIWTSSYVLHTTGLAMLALAVCVHLIEIRQRPKEMRGWVRFFEVFGRNPLFIFVLSGLVPRFLGLLRWQTGVDSQGTAIWTTPLPWLYQAAFVPLVGDPRLASLAFACVNVGAYAALAFWMDRRGLHFRV